MQWRGVVPVCVALATAACDHFAVSDYAGSRILLTINGAPQTPAGQHIEMWARDGDNDVIRLLFQVAPDLSIGMTGYSPSASAYQIVQTVDLNDPCMIDANGNLLWTPAAQVGPSQDEKMLQAKSITTRIHQLTDGIPLLAYVSYDDAGGAGRPQQSDPKATTYLAPDAAAADRLNRCKAVYWGSSRYAYDGNPSQLTAPLNGQLFGMLDYNRVVPPQQVLGGIEIDSQFALHDLREIWFTQTTATVAMVDPNELDCKAHPDTCRGTLLLQGDAGTPNNGIFHFDLQSPLAGVSGSAAVYTHLDQDPVQF